MKNIHPSAIINKKAQLPNDIEIGPYCIIGPDVKIGAGTKLGPSVVLNGHTEIGENCQLYVGAVVGTPPQDLSYKNEPTKVIIGNNTQLREYVTVHRASGEGTSTNVGDNCMIMAYTHIAHNCKIGNNVIMANYVGLAGHIQIDDFAFISGLVAVHQFVKIGKMSIISGFSATRQDIPPFSTTDGRPAVVRGINKVGLRRRGFTKEQIENLHKAFRIIWFENNNMSQSFEKINSEIGPNDEHVNHLLNFIKTSKRGVIIKTEQEQFQSMVD